jgi:hypothetical protein
MWMGFKKSVWVGLNKINITTCRVPKKRFIGLFSKTNCFIICTIVRQHCVFPTESQVKQEVAECKTYCLQIGTLPVSLEVIPRQLQKQPTRCNYVG